MLRVDERLSLYEVLRMREGKEPNREVELSFYRSEKEIKDSSRPRLGRSVECLLLLSQIQLVKLLPTSIEVQLFQGNRPAQRETSVIRFWKHMGGAEKPRTW